MCKYYAHRIRCNFQEKFGNCRQVHAKEVRDAHEYIQTCKKNETEIDTATIKNLINPNNDLQEIEQLVRQRLLNNYPKEPTNAEKDRAKEDEMREQINAAFQKMYGTPLEDDASETK